MENEKLKTVISNRRLLGDFIAEIKKEFPDDNWDYLHFIADRFIADFTPQIKSSSPTPEINLEEVEKLVQSYADFMDYRESLPGDALRLRILRNRIGYTLSDLPKKEKAIEYCQCDQPEFAHKDNEYCARCHRPFDPSLT